MHVEKKASLIGIRTVKTVFFMNDEQDKSVDENKCWNSTVFFDKLIKF